ncbi:MAG: hypothetical protein M1819_001737, partial [Sarea resinae]
DCHFECDPTNFEISMMQIPYPKLDVFAQALLDMHRLVDLTDLVDGMDLSKEWGEQHLDLSGTNDTVWAEQKNKAMRASAPYPDAYCLLEVCVGPFSRKEAWDRIVSTKARRIKPGLPMEVFATRFRPRGSLDPRLEDRVCA